MDLQGGSYLLLEIDTKPLIEERIQDKVIKFKNILIAKTTNIVILQLMKILSFLFHKLMLRNLNKIFF